MMKWLSELLQELPRYRWWELVFAFGIWGVISFYTACLVFIARPVLNPLAFAADSPPDSLSAAEFDLRDSADAQLRPSITMEMRA